MPFISRCSFLLLAILFAGSLILSACADSPKTTTNTAQPQLASTQTLDQYQQECEKTGCYKGLDATVPGFQLDAYKCAYLSERTAVWIVKTQSPEKYVAEGKKIDAALGKIETFLNRSLGDYYKAGERVHFFYGNTDTAYTVGSRYSKPVIIMPLASDPYSFHNYAHEMTHLLTPQHGDWVSEGLAVYVNDQYGEGGFPNYGQDIDHLSLAYLNRADILDHIGDEAYYPTRADLRGSVGQGFYILSGSFVKYLIEKAGIAVFMQAYSAPNMQEGLETKTKKTLQEWKTEWASYLPGLKE